MEQIKHKFVGVGAGINLHVADVGTGYRAIAPDYRGYGLSDPPPNPEEATFAEFAADMAAVLDSLGIQKVVVVAKDFGAYVASRFAVVYPERMLGLVTMGIPYTPPGPGASAIMALFPEGFYARRWMEHGRAEADFGRFDAKTVVRKIYILFAEEELPTAAENQEVFDLVEPSDPLPCWFTEDDLSTYGALYHNSGFQTALKVPYRADPTVKVPAMLILGDKDYVSKSPGFEDYANNGVKHLVQDLKIVHLSEGSHFVQEQFPEQVNELVLGFLGTRIWS
ncbi:Bifunctional epoxide hydrolase 2 [Linum grandiflorum]